LRGICRKREIEEMMKKICGIMLSVVLFAVVLYGGKEMLKQDVSDKEMSSVNLMDAAIISYRPGVRYECNIRDENDGKTDFIWSWNPVEYADGFEIGVKSKYYTDNKYSEYEYFESDKCSYILGPDDQKDGFFYIVKVRAFRGNGDDRLYSKWSNESSGHYIETRTEFSSYEELIDIIKKIQLYDEENNEDSYYVDYRFDTVCHQEGYVLRDLDEDGVDELIIGSNKDTYWDGPIDEFTDIAGIYSMKDGEIYLAKDLTGRGYAWFAKNGALVSEGPNGSSAYSYSYLDYKSGKEIDYIYEVYEDDYEDKFYLDYDRTKEIDFKECNRIKNKYVMDRLELTPFLSK